MDKEEELSLEDLTLDEPNCQTIQPDVKDQPTGRTIKTQTFRVPSVSWTPAGACFRADSADTEQMYGIDGKMVPASQVHAAYRTNEETYTYLLSLQAKPLEPAELVIAGNDPRSPDYDQLEEVQGQMCAACGLEITDADASWKALGTVVIYGSQVMHWECLATWVLCITQGDVHKASEIYGLDRQDLAAVRRTMLIDWGRLGLEVQH